MKYILSAIESQFSFTNDSPPTTGKIGKFGSRKFSFACEVNECEDEDREYADSVLGRFLRLKNGSCHKDVKLMVLWGEPNGVTLQLYEGTFLVEMAALFGSQNVRLKVIMSKFRGRSGNGPWNNMYEATTLESKGMTFLNGKACGDAITSSGGLRDLFAIPNAVINWRVLIDIEVNVVGSHLERPQANKLEMYKKMLHDEIHSDVVIFASDWDKIKCHKSVLSACSTVFETMLKTPMMESQTHEIKMPEMTQAVVRSFLAFIYYQDDEGPNGNPKMAYELLNAAHQYNVIPDLKAASGNLMLSKPLQWFELDMALKLFALARNLPSGEQLKAKALQAIKRNAEQLHQSQKYIEMFQKDQAAVMELCQQLAMLSYQ